MNTITIIEDNDDLRNLMRIPLESAGYEVVTYGDDNFLHDFKGSLSQLYFIDLDLGGVSGLDVCRRLKNSKDNKGAPIIIIISANPDVRELAMQACADDVLSKPFKLKDLLLKVEQYLKRENSTLF